jgi:hypothetical protein
MAKLSEEPITREDVQVYLDSYSDFTFEINTLNLLTKLRFKCRHSGTYTDPVTQRMREFDIRAVANKKLLNDVFFNLFLAVECKNLKKYFPLIVHCMPRTREESFEEMIIFYEDKTETDVLRMLEARNSGKFNPAYYAHTILQERTLSIYRKDEPVGKSTDQLGKQANKDELFTSDSDVFEKISQALNSSKDLVQEASGYQERASYNVSVVKPILVVPDGTLWQVLYDVDGNVVSGPEQTAYITYFYGKSWPYSDRDGNKNYTISHLDIVTLGHLEAHIHALMGFEAEDLVGHLRCLQERGEIADKVNLRGR